MDTASEFCNTLYQLAKDKNGQNVLISLNEVPVLIVQSLEGAEWVLRKNVVNYEKNMAWFKQLLGSSRFSENGRNWKIRQELSQPFMNKFNREKVFQASCGYAKKILEIYRQNSLQGQKTIDDKALRELTCSVLMKSFFDVSLDETTINLDRLEELMIFGSEYSFVPEGRTENMFKDKFERLAQLREQVLADFSFFRSPSFVQSNPMLQALIDADKDPSNNIVLEHEILTFLAAGSESSAATLGWACYLLAAHPEIQERLHEEIDAFWQSPSPDWEELSDLPLLLAFVSETLRLYPASPVASRVSLDSDQLGDMAISAGQIVLISFIGIQHDEKFHTSPWEINLPEAGVNTRTSRTSGLNTAFSFGPRICGGKQFAILEMLSVLSIFLRDAKFELTSDEKPVFYWKSQMLREGGHPIKVLSRN